MRKVSVPVALTILAGGCYGEILEPQDPAVGVSRQALTTGYSSHEPYLDGVLPGVSFQALLSVGDTAAKGKNKLVGIPDGMGAKLDDVNPNHFLLFVNHELNKENGGVRAHGGTGAFVSKWLIDKNTLQVLQGEDVIKTVVNWNPGTSSYNSPVVGDRFGRFCSADLPPNSAFYDDASGLGYDDTFHTNGEEIGFGRAMAHGIDDGVSTELPRLGKASWENIVANPGTGAKTVVAGLDDSGDGEVYIYVGDKTNVGSAIDKAGLTNGVLLGVKVDGMPKETNPLAVAFPRAFSTYDYGDVSNVDGATLANVGKANGVTAFNRTEDGHWNPANPNQLYFVTTASFSSFPTRLWRLTFVDARNPALGGTIDLLVTGTTGTDTSGPKMMDNITVTNDGQYVYMQEDPGGQVHLARIWRYAIATGVLEVVAQHTASRFSVGGANFLTIDEESSGIIDASNILGPGKFLLDVQAHAKNPDSTLVEYGQLLVMTVPTP